MSYSIINDRIAWRDKPIKTSSATGFRLLHPIIARSDTGIYVLGKPLRADPATFRVLSDGYASDTASVFLIQQTKLKPLPKADPATFKALGPNHGVDAALAFYLDKKIATPKGRDLSAMRVLSDHLCTDGARLYLGAKAVPMTSKAGIDWSRAKLRLLGPEDGVNLPLFAVADPTVRYFGAVGQDGFCLLDGASFENLFRLPQTIGRHANYVSDGKTLWYRGTALPAAKDAKAISHNLVEAAGQTYHRDTRTPYPDGTFLLGPPKVAGLMPVLSEEGLWHVPDHRGGDLELRAKRADQPQPDISAVLTRILSYARDIVTGAVENGRPEEANDLYASNAATATPLSAGISAQGITVSLPDGTRFTQPAQNWWTQAMQIHLHRTKGTGHLLSRNTSNWLPRGTETQVKVMGLLWAEFCSLLPTLYKQAPDDARVLAFNLFQVPPNHRRTAKPVEPFHGPLSAVPFDLIPLSYWNNFDRRIELTTNLGVLKLMLEPDWIAHDDWRYRIDAVHRLHSVIHDTPKLAQIGDRAFEVLKTRHSQEPVPYIVQQIEITIQMIAYSADRLPKRGTMDALRVEVLDWLIAQGINVADNTAAKAQM